MKFKNGTCAARVRFADAPASGPDGDHLVQTFFTIDRPPDRQSTSTWSPGRGTRAGTTWWQAPSSPGVTAAPAPTAAIPAHPATGDTAMPQAASAICRPLTAHWPLAVRADRAVRWCRGWAPAGHVVPSYPRQRGERSVVGLPAADGEP